MAERVSGLAFYTMQGPAVPLTVMAMSSLPITSGSTLVCSRTALRTVVSISIASVSLRPPRLACKNTQQANGEGGQSSA